MSKKVILIPDLSADSTARRRLSKSLILTGINIERLLWRLRRLCRAMHGSIKQQTLSAV